MTKFKKIIFIFAITILFASCSGISDAGKVLRNEKVRTTDEFLVKKRDPLSLPPEYETLPTPGSQKKDEDKKAENQLNQILKIPEQASSSNSSSTVEQSIINEIRK